MQRSTFLWDSVTGVPRWFMSSTNIHVKLLGLGIDRLDRFNEPTGLERLEYFVQGLILNVRFSSNILGPSPVDSGPLNALVTARGGRGKRREERTEDRQRPTTHSIQKRLVPRHGTHVVYDLLPARPNTNKRTPIDDWHPGRQISRLLLRVPICTRVHFRQSGSWSVGIRKTAG
jgi:hypothetical protein